MGVQREVEVGLGRRMRRELQVEPLILCLVQPAPAGTAVYKGRADAEPDNRPAPRGRRGGGGGHPVRRNGQNNGVGTPAPIRQAGRSDTAPARPAAPVAAAAPAPVAASAAVVEKVQSKPAPEPEMPAGRTRRRRSAAA